MNLESLLQQELSTLIFGWGAFIVGLTVKDVLTTFTFGIMFYFSKTFNEGDTVFLDGEESVIVKNGIVNTVFYMKDLKRWRYIRNDRLKYISLEKNVKHDLKE